MDIWKYRLDLGIMTVKDLVLSPQPNGFFAIVIHVIENVTIKELKVPGIFSVINSSFWTFS